MFIVVSVGTLSLLIGLSTMRSEIPCVYLAVVIWKHSLAFARNDSQDQ